jgi:hypothetical protein
MEGINTLEDLKKIYWLKTSANNQAVKDANEEVFYNFLQAVKQQLNDETLGLRDAKIFYGFWTDKKHPLFERTAKKIGPMLRAGQFK